MKKLLTAILILLTGGISAQTSITASDDTVICPPGCADLSCTYSITGGGATTDYDLTDIAYAPDPYAGTSVSLWDDSQTGLLPIGFEFCFYGDSYTQFVICSNNWIGFQTGETSTWVTSTVPSTAASRPRNCIMGPWQDINPSSGGNIRYQTLGVAPFRRLVVTYDNVPMYSCTSMIFSAQIIIYESTNVIENHIQSKPICASWNSGNAVQSLHDQTGTVANTYPGRNNTNWSVTNEAVRWTPNGPPLIEWYDDGGTLVGTGTDVTVCPIVPTTYTVQITGCDGTAIVSDDVFVDISCCGPPEMDSTDITCFGDCDGTATAIGDGAAPFTYLWDDPLAQTTATATGLCPGTYTCEVTDATGCVEIGTIEVVEPPELILTINSTTDETCELANGEIDASAVGGVAPLQYSIDGGSTWFPSGLFTGLTGGAYDVIVEDANGCQDIINVVLAGDPTITGSETVVDETCDGDCDGSIDITAATGPTPYSYSIDGCTTTSGSGLFTDLCPGDYDVCVEDANGCQYTNTVTIAAGPIVGDATITPVGPFCRDAAPVAMNAVTPGGTWSGTGMSGSSFDPAAAGPGIHTVTYSLGAMCGDMDTYDVEVFDLPEVDPISDITEGCIPLDINFSNAGSGTGTCVWEFGDGETASGCSPIAHQYGNDGVYDVTLTVTDANGCVNSTTLNDYITAYALPVANFTWDPMDADIMDPEIDFTDLSENATSWNWTFGNFTGSTAQNPTITFPQVGSYEVELKVLNDGGCKDSIVKLIRIDDVITFYIPNSFTPDGNGYNDVFKPAFTSGIDVYDFHFTIFNRWGEVIWESFNPAVGWDGTYGTKGLVQDDSFVWQLEFKETMTDKRHTHRGHVTILK